MSQNGILLPTNLPPEAQAVMQQAAMNEKMANQLNVQNAMQQANLVCTLMAPYLAEALTSPQAKLTHEELLVLCEQLTDRILVRLGLNVMHNRDAVEAHHAERVAQFEEVLAATRGEAAGSE